MCVTWVGKPEGRRGRRWDNIKVDRGEIYRTEFVRLQHRSESLPTEPINVTNRLNSTLSIINLGADSAINLSCCLLCCVVC